MADRMPARSRPDPDPDPDRVQLSGGTLLPR